MVCYADPPAAGATSAGAAGAPMDAADPIEPADHTSKFNKLMDDVVLPGLHKCVVDHSAQVRHTIARMLSFLLHARPRLSVRGIYTTGWPGLMRTSRAADQSSMAEKRRRLPVGLFRPALARASARACLA